VIEKTDDEPGLGHNDRVNTAGMLRDLGACLPLDAKRKPTPKKGLESWYPYYAGYSEEFTRGVFRSLASAEPLTVLDPWNGSGTTTRVAHELGHTAIGFDLNPVANLVASAKIVHPDDASNVTGLAKRLAEAERVPVRSDDPLSPWMAPSVIGQYRAIEARILAELATTKDGVVSRPDKGNVPPLAAFLLLALVRAARDTASLHRSTNPTWMRPGEGRHTATRTLGRKWVERLVEMAADLQARTLGVTSVPWGGRIALGDARKIPLDSSQVDVVLTSPPYCTRIDYVVSSSFELAALGVGAESPLFAALRRSSMGTPLARVGAVPTIPDAWPSSLRTLLQAIRTHKSKASRSYYFKTFHQYFTDAESALKEVHRVLRPGGLALFVVQTSYYKEICVDLPALYVDLGNSVGFRGHVAGQAAVRRALAQIHPHSLHHRKESQYREAVVALEKAA
jgi:DNA modification methylase